MIIQNNALLLCTAPCDLQSASTDLPLWNLPNDPIPTSPGCASLEGDQSVCTGHCPVKQKRPVTGDKINQESKLQNLALRMRHILGYRTQG